MKEKSASFISDSALRRPSGRIAYVGGRYLPHATASVHIEDRGLQFADFVYEVCAVSSGRIVDEKEHLDRLERSLAAIQMAMPLARTALLAVLSETIRRNRLQHGFLYLQVTRGTYPRDHPVPADARSTLIVTARALQPGAIEKRRGQGVAVVTRPDIRWGRCDIKSTGLLPNILAKSEARKAGAFEAWFADEKGYITEGSSTNAWIVTKNNVLVTRDLGGNILPGVTRARILEALAKANVNLKLEERPFSVEEAYGAREAFFSSTSGGVIPVIAIDGHKIGDGKPGITTNRVHDLHCEHVAGAMTKG